MQTTPMPTPIIQVPTHTFLGIIANKITVTFQSGNTSHITPREMYNRPTSYSIFDLLYNLVNHVRFARQKDKHDEREPDEGGHIRVRPSHRDNVMKVTIHLHNYVTFDSHGRSSDPIDSTTITLSPKPIAMTEYTTRYCIDDEFTTYTYLIQDQDDTSQPLEISNFFDNEQNTFVCGFVATDTNTDQARLERLKKLNRIPPHIDTSTVVSVTTVTTD